MRQSEPLFFFVMLVKGTRADLEDFRSNVQGFCPDPYASQFLGRHSPFCFNSVIPLPEEAYGSKRLTTLCEFRERYWGTQHDGICSRVKERPHRLEYFWSVFGQSPPWPILNKLIETYPHLKFEIRVICDRLGLDGYIVSRRGKPYQWIKSKFAHEWSKRAS